MKKIIFLDIDGTLVDFNMKMPETTLEALKKARENGHLLVLCTGRVYASIYSWLLRFGFDGVVASAGAHIIYGGKEIYHAYMETNELKYLSEVMKRHGAACVYQGMSGRYMDATSRDVIQGYFEAMHVNPNLLEQHSIIEEKAFLRNDIESGIYHNADIGIAQMQEEVGSGIQITGASFGEDREYCGEFTRMGVTKATGMQKVLEYIQMEQKDSIAFGDSPNDISMISYAGCGVAMGNAVDEVKDIADRITEDISKDGIYIGFQTLGLIE